MGKALTKEGAGRAARRDAMFKLVADQMLPGRVMITLRVYDDHKREYRTMPVSYVTPVRHWQELQRLWRGIIALVESETWTDLL